MPAYIRPRDGNEPGKGILGTPLLGWAAVPLVGARAEAVGTPGWARLQYSAACMWTGSGDRPN